MAPRLVLVRLDPDAEAALRVLTRHGASRSAAIRDALAQTAKRSDPTDLAAEAEALANDDVDKQEMASVAALMDSLRVRLS